MQIVRVNLPTDSYEVVIGSGVLSEVGRQVRDVCSPSRVLVVTDENVGAHYLNTIQTSLRSAGLKADSLTLKAGDHVKTLSSAEQLYDRLADIGMDRSGLLLAVGGGMVSDLAGFVAATWMRGIQFVICPTSLQAGVDAAVGGKTGVNHPRGKNLIGVFHQPIRVLIDVTCLQTLPDRELRAGLAESIKHGVIADETFFAWQEAHMPGILKRDSERLIELIERNVRIKADVVVSDERETCGRRALLNFGHTVGHAIEKHLAYGLRHGECVAVGMAAAGRIAAELGLFSSGDQQRLEGLIAAAGLATCCREPIDVEQVLDLIRLDKKSSAGKVNFVLPESVGSARFPVPVPPETIRRQLCSLSPS